MEIADIARDKKLYCLFRSVGYIDAFRLMRIMGCAISGDTPVARTGQLSHAWIGKLVCFTPCVIAVTWLSFLPINLWTTMLFLLLLSGLLYMCVLNIWMMSIIHNVRWEAAFVSTILGCVAMPVAYILIAFLYFMFGIVKLPHPS